MRLFDTHAHYDDRRFDRDREKVLSGLKGQDVHLVVNIGADMESSRRSIALAKQYDFIYATVGVHPHDSKDMETQDLLTLRDMVKSEPKVRAIGEIGLDYHYDHSPRDVQRERFVDQLQLAQMLKLPVVIHEREAARDCLDILKAFPEVRGVCHCFSGSAETAKELLKLGYMLSFTGVITYENARRSHEAIKAIPLERLMIETDCPYLTPEPFRGKRNDSGMLIHTLLKMAEIKGVTPEELAEITFENGKRFYGIA